MLRNVVFIILFWTSGLLKVASQEFVNYDHAYLQSIKSVQLYIPGLQNIPAFAQLQEGVVHEGQLFLNLKI